MSVQESLLKKLSIEEPSQFFNFKMAISFATLSNLSLDDAGAAPTCQRAEVGGPILVREEEYSCRS